MDFINSTVKDMHYIIWRHWKWQIPVCFEPPDSQQGPIFFTSTVFLSLFAFLISRVVQTLVTMKVIWRKKEATIVYNSLTFTVTEQLPADHSRSPWRCRGGWFDTRSLNLNMSLIKMLNKTRNWAGVWGRLCHQRLICNAWVYNLKQAIHGKVLGNGSLVVQLKLQSSGERQQLP